MGWHADGRLHITWGPEGEKLSAEEKDQEAAKLLAEADARREQHDKANAALAGMPFIAVPTEQLADLYGRMLRLIQLGQTSIKELETTSPEIMALRRKIFTEADFGAVYAGQWLPREIRKRVRDEHELVARSESAEVVHSKVSLDP